jgi:UDP-N-acetylmuramate dehydrogenase
MIADAERILRGSCGDRVRKGFPLASLTTFRIGGPAALFLEPESMEDLDRVSRAHLETGIPIVVLGKGSNVLVSDSGIDALVLRLGRGFRWTARDGDNLSAGAAMPLGAFANVALQHSLTGLEFGVAIPASVGGAVRMNAGANSGAMAGIVESSECFLPESGRVIRVAGKDSGFVYRDSSLPGIVISTTVRLVKGDPIQIKASMDEARDWRRRTQPLAEPNCGSVFRNPPDDHAARMIEEAGGKELSAGAATVSQKHANFITAGEGTTAADVLALIEKVQSLVQDRFGVSLQREVHLLGGFEGE